ncbi:hypothetical protein EB796_009951 [Bugula neritina]|uniref:Uncharacterized protein n=1 Tax=Bugula neritina TaxID=10212 RepID=A0A7J7K1A5_BUGNE|nr:hypothetical protein EB796_009951 [Bugula neritina]
MDRVNSCSSIESNAYPVLYELIDRQQSLPEIRQIGRHAENGSCATVSRRVLNLPLDKGSSRLLKQSAQNFFYQESLEKHEEDLAILKQNIETVAELCDQVCGGHVTSKDKLARIEQQISAAGKTAGSIWSQLKQRAPSENVEDDSPYSNLTPEALVSFCTIVENFNTIVCNYCSTLAHQGLISRYKWSEPDEVTATNLYMRAEELMTVNQSREYQVKFCHANIYTPQNRECYAICLSIQD